MIQSLYLDTSVFGGHYDEEFSEHTIPLFKRIANGEFKILFSTVTQEELEFAPEKIKRLVQNIQIEQTVFIDVSDEAVELAKQYIHEKVVGKTSFVDCSHCSCYYLPCRLFGKLEFQTYRKYRSDKRLQFN
jgi:hypothetical protein